MATCSESKLVRCGCGGEAMLLVDMDNYSVMCKKCGISTEDYDTEAEAITAWNKAMGNAEKSSTVERTAKVVDKSVGRHSIRDFDWIGKCEKCGNEIQYSFDCCPSCGARLGWE